MKRRLVLPLLIVVVLIGLIVLYYRNNALNYHMDTLEKSDNGNLSGTIENSDMRFELYIDGNVFNSTIKEIPYEIKNTGLKSVSFGLNYSIEIFKDGSWYKVPFKSNMTFIAIANSLSPGNTYKSKIDLKYLKYRIAKGKYRLVKEFTSNEGNVTAAAEFTIN